MQGRPSFWRGSALWVTVALGFFAVVAILGPWVAPQDPNRIDIMNRFAAPGAGQWLGRDELGRDVFSRILVGASVSLGVGLVAALLTTIVGALAGRCGRLQGRLARRRADARRGCADVHPFART